MPLAREPSLPTRPEPPPGLRWFSRVVGIATGLGMALSAASVLVSLVLVCYAVVMRYVFNDAPTWVDNSVGFLLVSTVMFAAPATMRQGGHISVDMLTGRLGVRGRRWTELWSTLAMLGVALVLIVNGWGTVQSSRMLGITTEGNLELPIWRLQALLPLGGALMALVGLEALWRLAIGLPALAEPLMNPHGAAGQRGTHERDTNDAGHRA